MNLIARPFLCVWWGCSDGCRGRGQRPTLNVLTWDWPTVVFETEGSLIRLTGRKVSGAPCLCLPSPGITSVRHSVSFFVGSED